jgi:hypothetical protein
MSVRMQPAVLDAEPAWEIAKIFPAQGAWAEEDYLLLPGNRLSVYAIHGVYDRSSVAESALLPGFTVDVEACFAEGEQA